MQFSSLRVILFVHANLGSYIEFYIITEKVKKSNNEIEWFNYWFKGWNTASCIKNSCTVTLKSNPFGDISFNSRLVGKKRNDDIREKRSHRMVRPNGESPLQRQTGLRKEEFEHFNDS